MKATPISEREVPVETPNTPPQSARNSGPQTDYGNVRSSIPKISDIEKDLKLREAVLKERLFGGVVPYFLLTNAIVLVGIAFLIVLETYLAYSNAGYTRLTSENTLICLLTATTVQMGAIALRIGKSLFR